MFTILAINKLKPNLCYPDNLPPVLFKKVKHCLIRPLSLLFSLLLLLLSLLNGSRLLTIITPVFKKDTTGDVSNYRPISLTCVACKLMERLLSVYTLVQYHSLD